MKKFLFLLFSLCIIGGTSYALFPGLFPNTATLPRVPVGDGTIGKVFTKILGVVDLANYASDGTVVNTSTFSGITASGYLKNDGSCPGTQKYIGIDADGRRLCGIRSTLLTDYGKILTQDCPADYYRIDNSQGTTATGDTLKAGDIVKTPVGCTLTIVFADTSILRLDGDTTLSLDLGSLPDGTTIASAILSNGSVWGRILTETGSYTIGTDIIVVGVRGTSLALSSTGNTINITNTGSGWGILKVPTPSQTIVNLVDSRFSSGASILCKNKVTQLLESLDDLKVGDSYAVNPLGCETIKPAMVSVQKHLNFTTQWIRRNTRKDIEYMYHLRSVSGVLLTPTKSNLLRDEILASIPNVSGTGVLTISGVLEAGSICESGFRWWNEREGCQEDAILAIADYTRPIPTVSGISPMLFYGNPPTTVTGSVSLGTATPDAGQGIIITSTGYISLPLGDTVALIGGSIHGRSFIIETYGPVANNKTLMYFGDITSKAGIDAFGAPKCKIQGLAINCLLTNLSGAAKNKWKVEILGGFITEIKIGGEGTLGLENKVLRVLIQ